MGSYRVKKGRSFRGEMKGRKGVKRWAGYYLTISFVDVVGLR